jgi:uncharacterized protein (DUF58 family)
MRTHIWTSIAVWAALGAAYVYRGGFAFAFVFYAYSTLCIYGLIVGWIGLRGLKVTRLVYEEGTEGGELSRTIFTAGDEADVEITLRRPFPLPLAWIAVRDQAGEWRHEQLCGPWLGREMKYRYVLPLPERGVYRFSDIEIWTGDPFGIVSSKIRAAMPLCEAAAAPKPYIFDSQTEQALLSRNAEESYGGHIREFREGDPIKHVVWKTAARSDRWMVRTPADDTFVRDTAVLVDSTIPEREVGGTNANALLDLCAEAAAGVCLALTRRRRSFTVWDGKPAVPNKPWSYRLAALERSEGLPLMDAARRAVTLGTELVIVVSARADADAVALCRDIRSRGMNLIYMFVSLDRGSLEQEHSALAWIGKSGCRVVEIGRIGGARYEESHAAYTS